MKKIKEENSIEIISLLKSGDEYQINQYLLGNSKLPGPSANLSLAYEFADYYEENDYDYATLTNIEEYKDDNNPTIFLSFCKLLALGSIYYKVKEKEKNNIIELLNYYAIQDSWRLKEGSAMAYQRIGKKDPNILITIFNKLYLSNNMLSQRLVLATLADYPLLTNPSLRDLSLKVSEHLLNNILTFESDIYKTSEYKVLKKGLDYSLSVFISVESSGFALLEKFAKVNNKQIKSIIKSNIGKSRLLKKYPDEVEKINKALNEMDC